MALWDELPSALRDSGELDGLRPLLDGLTGTGPVEPRPYWGSRAAACRATASRSNVALTVRGRESGWGLSGSAGDWFIEVSPGFLGLSEG